MNILLLLVIAVTVGAVVFGVMTLVTGGDPGLKPAEPDTRARPLPSDRPLLESDIGRVTFDTAWRGYRMDQVDQTLRRLAYDIGYKGELIEVLEAEVVALREGRMEDADTLARTRAAALSQRQPSGEVKPELELVTSVAPESAQIDLDEPDLLSDDRLAHDRLTNGAKPAAKPEPEPEAEAEDEDEPPAEQTEGKSGNKSESMS